VPKLEYSVGAKNVLAKFYRVDKILYVEGDDDISFWELLFEKFDAPQVDIQQVGGKEELRKYIDQISSGELDAIVAMDSDFSPVNGTDPKHNLILRTAGHSIENTLISAKVLMKVARRIGRLPAKDVSHEECEAWLADFYRRCSMLITNDIQDQCEGAMLGVIGDNCDRFLESKQSDRICPLKIETYLNGHGLNPGTELSDDLEKRMTGAALNLQDFIRGHFLISAAHKFVCLLVKRKRSKVSLSSAAFFGAINLAFESTFNCEHPHYAHYSREFQRLVTAG
jgi:hypothetical protein